MERLADTQEKALTHLTESPLHGRGGPFGAMNLRRSFPSNTLKCRPDKRRAPLLPGRYMVGA